MRLRSADETLVFFVYCFFGPSRIFCLREVVEKAKIAFEQEHACSGLYPNPGCTKDDETSFGVST